MAAVISTIYNSVKHMESSGDISTENDAILQLCSARGLCAQLLLAAAPTTSKLLETSTTSSSSSNRNSSSLQSHSESSDSRIKLAPADPVLEWLHILFFYLLKSKNSSLLRMFQTLKPRDPGENVWDFKLNKSKGADNLAEDFKWMSSVADTNSDSNRMVLTHEQVSPHSLCTALFLLWSALLLLCFDLFSLLCSVLSILLYCALLFSRHR